MPEDEREIYRVGGTYKVKPNGEKVHMWGRRSEDLLLTARGEEGSGRRASIWGEAIERSGDGTVVVEEWLTVRSK